MTTVTLLSVNHSPFLGAVPKLLYGEMAVDGDAPPFDRLPVGSRYYRKVSDYHTQEWVKVQDTNSDHDWACVAGVIVETHTYATFTDGGAALGTKALATQLPAGAYFEAATAYVDTGFTGNTTAALTIGVDGGDVDRYNTGTPSVLAAGYVDVGVPSGARTHTAAGTVTLHVTGASDFTLITAGSITVKLHYRI